MKDRVLFVGSLFDADAFFSFCFVFVLGIVAGAAELVYYENYSQL